MNWVPATKDSLLWKNKNGDIGIRTAFFREPELFVEYYMYTFSDSLHTPYKDVIDPKSFVLVAGGYGWGGCF